MPAANDGYKQILFSHISKNHYRFLVLCIIAKLSSKPRNIRGETISENIKNRIGQ